MYKQFVEIMNNVISESGAHRLPKKYLNQKKNYQRHIGTIKKIRKTGMSKGLDFGCGIGSCCVLGTLAGLNMAGIDIPTTGVKRDSVTKKSVKTPDVESRYLSVQKQLISMGYNIHIMDTTKFPWNNFENEEFEFITFYWSINKQFMHKEWSLEDRIRELSRITKKGGKWFIHPLRYKNKITTEFPHLLQHINVSGWK